MPRRVTVRTALDPDDAEWLAEQARVRGIEVAECLRRLVRASRELHQTRTTVTGRPFGPTPKPSQRASRAP